MILTRLDLPCFKITFGVYVLNKSSLLIKNTFVLESKNPPPPFFWQGERSYLKKKSIQEVCNRIRNKTLL